MIMKMCDWFVVNGFSKYPLHFSRFHPMYKLTQLPDTPLQTLLKAREIDEKAGLKYVFIGNVPSAGMENTKCPGCKKVVVERKGFVVLKNYVENSRCKFCQTEINGVWN